MDYSSINIRIADFDLYEIWSLPLWQWVLLHNSICDEGI